MYLFAKKLRRSQEKNIFWTIFSLSKMMSKCLKDKNQPKFFYAPLIPLTLQILYKERKKNLTVLKKHHPVVN